MNDETLCPNPIVPPDKFCSTARAGRKIQSCGIQSQIKFMSDPEPDLSALSWDLLEVKDSSLLISQVRNISDYRYGNLPATEIYYDQIEELFSPPLIARLALQSLKQAQ